MARQILHHPAIQIAVPFVVGILIHRIGDVMTEKVNDIPVQSIRMQPKPPTLAPLFLPTVYIPGKAGGGSAQGGDIDALFNAESNIDGLALPPEEKTPPPSFVEMSLADYLSRLSVDGVTAGGAFIEGIFYRYGGQVDVEVPRKDGTTIRPTVVGIVGGKLRLRAGDETCDLPIEQ